MQLKFHHAIVCTILLIIVHVSSFAQEKSVLSGFVKEANSSEHLPGAIIKILENEQFVYTNEYGFYSISLNNGTYTLEVYLSGYEPIVETISIDGNKKLDLNISKIDNLEDVVITANTSTAQNLKTGTHQLEIDQIKSVPTLLGEKDVFKVLKLLPGVQKGQEGSSGFQVRGGGADQNLIILDDAIVYNASHLFGFFSTFNGDALKGVELIKGGFPAKYGERLSSVLNLTMKDGNKKYFTGEYGIGLLSSRGTLEGPIIKDKASFLISGRRTYADLLAQPFIMSQAEANGGYYFYDLNAKINYQIDDNNSLYLSGYFGRDRFYMKSFGSSSNGSYKMRFGWGNATGTLRWNHVFNPKLFANLTINYSNYNMMIRMTDKFNNESYEMRLLSAIDDLGAKYDVTYYLNNQHTLRAGYKITHHLFRPNGIVVKENNITDTTFKDPNRYNSWEHNLYIDDEWKLSKSLAMNLGLRASSFTSEGKSYFNIEPRATARVLLSDNQSVKASYTIMNQYMHLLTSTGINLPTDLWVPATDRIAPQRAYQYSLGYFQDFSIKNLSLSLEGYYKTMDNIISYKEGASFMMIEDPFDPSPTAATFEDNVTSGIGKSYGVEMMLKKSKGKFNGWISYTWSKTQYKFDEVNGGQWFYPRIDRRHDISIVGFYEISPSVKLNALFTLATGNPVNLPQYNIDPIVGMPSNGDISRFSWTNTSSLYSLRNEFRTEIYHRMDVGIQFLKKRKRGIRTWEISFYNVYNRKNPFFYMSEYQADLDQAKLYKYTIFPFIPSISYAFKFN